MALALTPDLSGSCVVVDTGPGELCVPFPGGAQVCAQDGYDTGDAGEITKSMFAQLNTAMAPLAPFFDILDLIKAIVDSVSAVPKAIGGDLPALVEAIEKMAKAISKIAGLFPPMPIFAMVKQTIEVIIVGIRAVQDKLRALIRQQERIALAATRAAETGNLQLGIVVDCAQGNFSAQIANMNTQFLPLNRLIGVVNTLLEVAGLPCIPTLGGIAGASLEAIDALDNAITFLQTFLAAIPIGDVQLPALPAAGTC
jgi:hypothetical protein